MSASATPPADSPIPAPNTARRLRMAQRLADIGMALAELLEQQAHAAIAADPTASLEGVDLKFARISRAVRLTLALEERLEQANAAPQPKPAPPTRWEAAGLSFEDWNTKVSADHRRDLIYETLEKAIELEPSAERQDQLILDLSERLDEDRDEAMIAAGAPLGEVIAAICRDLDLKPDWRALDTSDLLLGERDLAALRLGRFDPPPPQAEACAPDAAALDAADPDSEPDLAPAPQPPPLNAAPPDPDPPPYDPLDISPPPITAAPVIRPPPRPPDRPLSWMG